MKKKIMFKKCPRECIKYKPNNNNTIVLIITKHVPITNYIILTLTYELKIILNCILYSA